MQSGELIVTGTGQATIPLHAMPGKVTCHFKHEHDIVPCNPNNEDSLAYDVHYTPTVASTFALIITWDVSGVREIVWHAYY